MKVGIYAIYDNASGAFVFEFRGLNDRKVELDTTSAFKNQTLPIKTIYEYPSEYSLYKIADYDDNTGLYENVPQHILVLNFGSLVVDK